MSDSQELSDELDLEFLFERESLSYKTTRGRSGDQINAKDCPACGNDKSRVYLNVETGIGNCFVCNQTFNKMRFVHTYLHGDPDSKKWRETFSFVREVLREQGWRPKRTTTVAVDHGEVKLPFSFPLPTDDGQNLLYLEKRGIDGELAKFFHLRYCEEGWWRFNKVDGSASGMKFDNRLLIPVYDLDGTLVTFQGRDLTGESESKYLFPPMLPGTGRFLFNGQNAVRAKRVVMGEGAFDVMAVKKAVDDEVALRDIVPVGSFGKHLSYGDVNGNDQLGRFMQLKAHGLEEVIIMWDGEEKALVSALDAARLLRGIGLRVRIALLPSDKDPNEVPGEIVRQAIWKAVLFTNEIDIKWRLMNPYKVPRKDKSILSA
jgi:DNA primase